ncbi:MAG: Nitrogenase cofactor biosynthesis protein [Holophagaceae bacterium]|nr:Nitrogenase cofactor biosynthesis protein [Holophagaceae bacterium]
MNKKTHPCFDADCAGTHSRLHLPVAPKCNLQCKFCDRKFDCLNESRPGVSSALLTPWEAADYVDRMATKLPNLSVIGIAGPGDPFANPDETLNTFRLVAARHPGLSLCVATNGLELLQYVPNLKSIGVSHVTVTVNAVDPEIGQNVYSWFRVGRRALTGVEGATILLERQEASIKALKEAGILVKINSIVIPGVNEHHMEAIAARMQELGADLMNCMPMHPSPNSTFAPLGEPSPEIMTHIKEISKRYLGQMEHCNRCRADAAGIIGQDDTELVHQEMMAAKASARATEDVEVFDKADAKRPCIAIATREGLLVNQHLGEAESMRIYRMEGDRIVLVGERPTPEPGGGQSRWQTLGASIADCQLVLCSGVGEMPKTALEACGLKVLVLEGLVDAALKSLFANELPTHMLARCSTQCGEKCSGTGAGCG